MASEESDDEPLSVLAENKKLHPEKYAEQLLPEIELVVVPRKKKKKNLLPKKLIESVTIKLSQNMNQPVTRPVIDRPADVWLYLKDFNPAGPYSCLLCTEWFVNRSKMIIHYVLNHKKDFCGICRYFVPDRQAWLAHLDFHAPWLCSQCVENFETDTILRHHLSSVHKLVHCRLCHFRLPDDDQYHTHLLKKHNVTDVTSKDAEYPWEIEYDGCPKFLCLLCSKPNLNKTFFAHYMGYHHFTLKCFTRIISGRDPPFAVSGADVSSEFVDGQLKNQAKYGYVDIDRKPFDFGQESDQSMHSETNTLMNVLIPAIKQEEFSEPEEPDEPDDPKCEEIEQEDVSQDDHITKTYKGDEDFDVTLMELVMLQKCYSDYVNRTLNDINSNLVPQKSDIDYETVNMDFSMDVDCALCKTGYNTLQDFTAHMSKMHCAKIVPLFSCRVCATVFDTKQELESHLAQEMGDFEDLWLCQFCDNEYNDREETRRHLTSHWELIEYDNCFSPHLGFKCKYCPTLFWNETDRETHQVRVHFNKHKEDYYKCDSCSEIFSDKIWFIHHYLGKHLDKDANMPLYLLKCCLCCVVLSTMSEIRSHFESNHPEARKVFCSLDACKYKPFSHRKSFKLHLRTIHNPSAQTRIEGSVSCAVCAREFASSRACSAHMAQVHGPGKFKCKLCREVLHTMDERKLHYLIRHPGRHPFECNECGKSFQYKSSLYMHKQEHVPNKKAYTCSVCGKIFMKKDSFREHVQIHEGPRHACSYCPMRFVQRSNMLRHERRHTGERPYACPHCPRTFADKGACTSHSRTHSKETSYACVYCGQTFVQKSKLTYHTRKHTGENLETCSVCSKLFTSACSLREHMKVHVSKEMKTVKCPLCDRRYQDERYMMRHLRSAHTRAHFSCPLCSKSVTSASGLRHHVITHSDLNTFQCKICPKSYSVKRSIIKHLRRRHGLQGNEINIKDFFTRLDPRECNLGLEEDVMTTIFGPPKKRITDVIISDYVTLKKKPKAKPKENVEETEKNEESEHEETEHSEEDSKANSHNDNEGGHSEIVVIKTERKEESDEELEPTDFVSVKIECVEEVNDSEMQ